MSESRIVVLGGGFGGAAAALQARRLLGDEHRVTLIDRTRVSRLCGANPLIMVGAKRSDEAIRSLGFLEGAGVDVQTAEIEALDLDARAVETSTGSVGFDHLVIALGVTYDWDAVPGSGDAYSFYDRDRTVALRERLDRIDGGTVLVAVAGTPYRCPPAPLEGALMLDWSFRRRGIRDDVRIEVAIPEPKPLGVAGPEASSRVSAVLDERGVALHTGVKITEVAEGGSMARFSDGSAREADVVVMVPVHRVPGVVVEAGLAEPGGWVRVDPATLETPVEGVFAIGDVNAVPVPPDKAIPKAGVFASDQGRLVASIIASRLLDAEPPPPYEGVGHCFIAFSGTEAAQVGGTFLADGGPDVGLGPIGDLAIKERWEDRWASFEV